MNEVEFKTPFIVDYKKCDRLVESKNGKVECRYTIIPYYYVGIVESKDRTLIKAHTVIFDNLQEIVDYIEELSK